MLSNERYHHEHEHDEFGEHHDHGGSAKPPTLPLLKYMRDHNEEHAKELDEVSSKLMETDMADPAALLREAAELIRKGNSLVGNAIAMIEASSDTK